MTIRRIALAGVLFAGAAALVLAQPRSTEDAMARAATALLSSLDATQRGKIQFTFDHEERFNWHFIPRTRLGLPLKEMSEKQRDAAFALLRTGLSAQGFTKAETIRSFEHILFAQSKNAIRDAELYFFSIFGDPDAASWGWRYEGHHISQNWMIARGQAIATAPAFLGANPAEVRDGPQKGARPLGQEEDLARAFLRALTPEQLKQTIVNTTAPRDILTMNSRTASRLEHGGITASRLTAEQRTLLMTLIEQHAMVQAPALTKARLQRVAADTFDRIQFAWLGSTERGGPHYYSIQGASFLIEYDNTQNNANHQHVVWRDFAGDFGTDVLREHYLGDPHHLSRR